MEFSNIKKLYKDEMPVPVLMGCIKASVDKTPVLTGLNSVFTIHDLDIGSKSMSVTIKVSDDRYRLEYTPGVSSILEKGSDRYFYSTSERIARVNVDVAEYFFSIASYASKIVPELFKDTMPVSPDCIPEDVMLRVLDCISIPEFDVDIIHTSNLVNACSCHEPRKTVFVDRNEEHVIECIYVPGKSFLTNDMNVVGLNTKTALGIANIWKRIKAGVKGNIKI